MKKLTLNLFIGFAIAGLVLCGPASSAAKDKIVFGQALSLSGMIAMQASFLEVPAIKLWLQEVNAKGGIYVKELGKRLPVELLRYDDKSDVETMLKLVKRLVTEDKVDFLFPPSTSAMHFAMLPLANKYGYPIVTWTVASEKLLKMAPKLPYIFHTSPPPSAHMEVGKDLCRELGVRSAALIYIQDLAGIEYSGALKSRLEAEGIKVTLYKSYPFGSKDLSPLLKRIKSAAPDALIAVTYPPDALMITEQSMVIGLNPKLFCLGIGGAMPMYRNKFGAPKLEGVMAFGGWSPKSSPEAQDYFQKYQKLNKIEPDYWSASYGYATYQIYEQAIEKAGSLDRDKVSQALATGTFTRTAAGNIEFKFEGQFSYNVPSYYGQWQNGVFQAIAPKKTRTATPVYPKPPWPK
ncbi:MAG: amino acid ABC transporter substrate-binding protein [Deltaproteobacteria bacterium]|nr:amino acid ABC transporter substrate-binding protein [Deltaproteobacteria bacterium]